MFPSLPIHVFKRICVSFVFCIWIAPSNREGGGESPFSEKRCASPPTPAHMPPSYLYICIQLYLHPYLYCNCICIWINICVCISKWIAPFSQTLRPPADPRSHAAFIFVYLIFVFVFVIVFVYVFVFTFVFVFVFPSESPLSDKLCASPPTPAHMPPTFSWEVHILIAFEFFLCTYLYVFLVVFVYVFPSKWITHFGQTLQLPVPRHRPFLEKPIQIEAAVPPESLLTSRSELDLRLQLWLKQQQGKHPHQRKSLLQILSRRFQQAWDHLIVVQQQDDGPSAFELTPVNQLGRVRSLPSGKPWK